MPLAGALFVLEVLMRTFSFPVMIPALAWAGLGNETQYHLSGLAVTPSLLVWSLLVGPLFGLARLWLWPPHAQYPGQSTAQRSAARAVSAEFYSY
ncbi:MAG: hypothetical protein ACR5LG_13540 [Sodalis sp. (in: enterobacteria)]